MLQRTRGSPDVDGTCAAGDSRDEHGCRASGARARAGSGGCGRVTASASTRRTWQPVRYPSRMPLRTVRRRGRYMQEAVPVGEGAMAAVLGLDAEAVTRACAEAAGDQVVTPANLNAPGQVVIAGHTAAVARAGERAKALGAKRVIPLAVSAPFHCALMKPAEDRLAPELRALTAAAPSIPVVANVDAQPKRTGRRGDRRARPSGVVSRSLGGCRPAPDCGRGHDIRRTGPGNGAGWTDQEDRSERQGAQRGRRCRPVGGHLEHQRGALAASSRTSSV